MEYLYWTNLDVQAFSLVLNRRNIQNSHKLYWLSAVLKNSTSSGQILFDDIANDMIIDAWYTVSEFHVHLGPCKYDMKEKSHVPQDAIEVIIRWLLNNTSLNEKSSREELLAKLVDLKDDGEFIKRKQDIVRYAPYRLLSPFLKDYVTEADFNKDSVICAHINEVNKITLLPYTINMNKKRLLRSITIPDEWRRFFVSNRVELLGWIERVKIEYLQDRNPEMPGMVYKLSKGGESRDLRRVRALWDAIMEAGIEVFDIYSGELIKRTDYDVDHFIPWTYVANNEMWNLCPVKSSINLDKSNRIAPEEFVECFINIQLFLFGILKQEQKKCSDSAEYSSPIIKAYEECKKEHLFAQWAVDELYNFEGEFKTTLLRKHIVQLREAALTQGFSEWKLNRTHW